MAHKPTVTYEGRTYTCRRWKVEIPDLDTMSRLHALIWLNQNTIPTGVSTGPSPVNLAGYPGLVTGTVTTDES